MLTGLVPRLFRAQRRWRWHWRARRGCRAHARIVTELAATRASARHRAPVTRPARPRPIRVGRRCHRWRERSTSGRTISDPERLVYLRWSSGTQPPAGLERRRTASRPRAVSTPNVVTRSGELQGDPGSPRRRRQRDRPRQPRDRDKVRCASTAPAALPLEQSIHGLFADGYARGPSTRRTARPRPTRASRRRARRRGRRSSRRLEARLGSGPSQTCRGTYCRGRPARARPGAERDVRR